jgi:hypothetical protein
VHASDSPYYMRHERSFGKAKKQHPEHSGCSHVVSVPNVLSDRIRTDIAGATLASTSSAYDQVHNGMVIHICIRT